MMIMEQPEIIIGDGSSAHQAILSSNNEQDLVFKTGSTAGSVNIIITDGPMKK